MAEEKKTQMGTAGPKSAAPTTNPPPNQSPSQPPAGPLSSPGAVTSYLPPVEDPLLGQVLAGRYLVSRKLGEGGMGAVYLATHNLLDKQVALKVLHGEFARKPDLVERFMQEAKAASRIRHENVIDISDFGSTGDGQVFFAMELLKGHDLHEEIARARLAGELLPWPRSKKIFLQICGALTAAHDKNIVHRDLKPENIYLVDFLGEPDFVKLLDFGIAKLTEHAEGDRKLTRTGMLFGTPEYMSPEQARGETADLRVDIYAMGCILFQLVTGRVPFEAENFMGVLSLHLTEEPPQIPPEVFDRIGAPREIAGVITRALLKDRNQRWQTIAELANAIRTVCGDAIPSTTMSVAMASVPAPSTTSVRSTGATGALGAVAPSPTPAPMTQNRGKAEWTGSLQIPDEPGAVAAKRAGSKLPLVVGILAVLGAGGAIAFVMATRKTAEPGVGSGSTAPIVAVVADAAPPPPPPDAAPPAIVLPDLAEIHLDSIPHGADVFDTTNNRIAGKTPLGFKIPGALGSRQFILKKAGYSDMVIELIPNRALIEYSEKLVKGAAGTVVTKHVPDPPVGPGSAVVKPDAIDAGVALTKPPDPVPVDAAVKVVEPPKPDCPPDEFPCLKEMPKDTPKP